MGYKLMCPDRPPVGENIHRAGWPIIRDALEAAQSTLYAATPLDDFCEVWFSYGVKRNNHVDAHRLRVLPHLKIDKWAGTWHHPATVRSLIADESQRGLIYAIECARHCGALQRMSHAICFSPDQMYLLRYHAPDTEVFCFHHPAAEPDVRWNVDRWVASGERFFQPGFYLRDTRMIHRLGLNGQAFRSRPYLGWHRQRDMKLAKMSRARVHAENTVTDLERFDGAGYDTMIASSVIVNHCFGAAANNVLCEAIAAVAPILTNRTPSSEYYLGHDYPLLYDDEEQAREYVRDKNRIIAAHEHIRATKLDLSIDTFVKRVTEAMR